LRLLLLGSCFKEEVSMIRYFLVATLALVALAVPAPLQAHCDSLDGPVIAAARLALGQGDMAPVLKWIKPEAEGEVRAAFRKALAVRGAGGEARELADAYFFETLVRLHRAGEGAPYTGLKPAGSIPMPIAAADRALDQGSVEELSRMLADHMMAGVKERFARAGDAKAGAEKDPAAGRRYVEAYVQYVHYIEAIVSAVHGAAGHAHAEAVHASGERD
jgi:hypothetical protein